jgi:hypothetical protein
VAPHGSGRAWNTTLEWCDPGGEETVKTGGKREQERGNREQGTGNREQEAEELPLFPATVC